jgi:hypothetical protein
MRLSLEPSRRFFLAATLLLLLVAPLGAHAQSSTTGAIAGTVADAGGAMLPNAKITVTNQATGAVRTVTAGKSGDYRIADLEPGVYSAAITADGFKTAQVDIITVTVGSVATVAPKLTIGSANEKVEVTDQAPDMHMVGAEISTTLDQNTIDNLPINGRRWSDFALLTPGVVSNSDGFGLLSFRGISYLLNNNTVDGADDNQAYFSEARGRTRSSYTVTQGAVQEFQVNTSNYSAEYGRAAGGVINTITKSGSNKLRGEVFFYDRDNALGGASNPYTQIYNFNPTTGLNIQNVKPKDWRKQWGFGVGGAILRDRIFWFYAYDQSRRNFPGVARTSDPYDLFALARPQGGQEACTRTADAYGYYDFGAPTFGYTSPNGKVYPGSSVTANLSTPALGSATAYPIGQSYQGNFGACALAAAIAPTTANNTALPYATAAAYYNQGLGVLASFFGIVPRTGDQVINFPKLDFQINDRNRATIQYNRLRWDSPQGVQTQTSNFYGRGSYGSDYVKADVAIFRLSTVVTNSVVNSFLAQYGRDLEDEYPSAPLSNELALVNPLAPGECSNTKGKPCVAAAPDLSVGYGYDAAGFDGGTSALFSRFALPDERRLQLKDDLAWSHGAHSFKFGLDYNKVTDFINNLYNGYGTYDFDWAYSFIGDYLHATTNLGGTNYAGGGTPNGGYYNFGLYSSYQQGYTVPQNYNPTLNTGTPDNVGASSLIATREYAGYATDDWRISPKLTLTLGARYEYEYVPANPTPNPAFTGKATDSGIVKILANGGTAMPDTTSRPDDRNNIGPRLGFAYNVYGDNKTILRGGYGMYFGRIINANIEQSYQNSGGPGSQVNVSGLFSDSTTGSVGNCKIVFPQTIPTYIQAQNCAAATNNASSHPSVSYLDSHLQNPQVHEADLAIEQDLGHNLTLGITYMASFARELDSANDINPNLAFSRLSTYYVNNTVGIGPGIANPVLPHGGKPAPINVSTVQVRTYGTDPTGAQPASTARRYDNDYYRILRIASNVNSKYNALAFQLNKRYRNGFSFLSNFTWSHALDYNPYIGTGIPGPSQLDPADPSKDYGNSSLDVRHRFVLAFVYQPQTHFHGYKDVLFGGWRLAPILQAQSGLPYTPYVSGYPIESVSGVRSANGAGGTSGRIDAIRRNQYYRPKTTKADVRLGKNFYFNVDRFQLERVRLEFLAEVFNVANHQNITGIQNTAYNLSGTNVTGLTPAAGTYDVLTLQPNFGTYTNSNSNYTYTPRQVQLAVRLHF